MEKLPNLELEDEEINIKVYASIFVVRYIFLPKSKMESIPHVRSIYDTGHGSTRWFPTRKMIGWAELFATIKLHGYFTENAHQERNNL